MLGVVLLVALTPVADPAAKAEKVRADEVKRLEGTWKAVKINLGVPKEEHLTTFKGNIVTFGGRSTLRFQIDPSKEPKWFDLIYEHKDEKVVFPGIYKLDGDTLTIYHNSTDPELGRPKRFDEKFPGQIIELERVKKK